jgi:hypothetical protein
MPVIAFAEDNVLTWDATTDPRVEATEIDRCYGTIIECSAQGANWVNIGQAPMPETTFTEPNVQEGRNYSYQAYFWNQDQGRGPGSNVAGKRVPFVAAPADTPNLLVQ